MPKKRHGNIQVALLRLGVKLSWDPLVRTVLINDRIVTSEDDMWDAIASARETADPWVDVFVPLDGPRFEGKPLKIKTSECWAAVGQDIGHRTQLMNERLGQVMRVLGFENKIASFNNKKMRAYVRRVEGAPTDMVEVRYTEGHWHLVEVHVEPDDVPF